MDMASAPTDRPVTLVTGATGFLGGSLVRALVARGDSVRALVRAGSARAALSALDALGVERAVGDVLDPVSLARAAEGAGAVIHCAGKLGRAGANDDEYLRIHAGGTRNVLEAAYAAGARRVMHLSSPGILGPIHGDDAAEDAPLNPTNVYERAKAAAERIVFEVERERGRALAVIVRPEFVYGPFDMHVLRLFRSIQRRRFFFIGSGGAVCHPTYVDDAVAGMLAAFDRGSPGRIFHIAGPRPVSIRELVHAFAAALEVKPPRIHVPERVVRGSLRALRPIARMLGAELPIDASGVDFFTLDRHFSWQRAKSELGFTPQTDVAEGARKTVAWYQARSLL